MALRAGEGNRPTQHNDPRYVTLDKAPQRLDLKRLAMLKLTIATIFVAFLAGVGAAAACMMEPPGKNARIAPHFTKHETPNHRHLLRYRVSLHD